jgi:hypothetical protein
MTQDALTDQLNQLAEAVKSDPRWVQDDISITVFGMLLYGYALAIGRFVMLLEIKDIDTAVYRTLTGNLNVASKWCYGLVADANASAFNKIHHPGNHELIGVGHSYFGVHNQPAIIDNVFGNITKIRNRLEKSA